MYNFLSLLFILNLSKIREISPKKESKYKAIVLYRTSGIDDLIESQKKYNQNILYLACPREFFKCIFFSIFKDNNFKLADFNYSQDNKNFSNYKKEKYKKVLVNFLKILKKRYNFDIIISFSFLYTAERELHSACNDLKIPFLILFKESIHTEIQKKYFLYTYKKLNEKFNGYKIAVYSRYSKKVLVDSNIANKDRVEIIGCSRLNKSFSYKQINPKNQILYFAIQPNRGLPSPLIESFGKKFYKNFKDNSSYDLKYNWKTLHLKTLEILKDFAKINPKISIIIKIKNGELPDKIEYSNLPNNIQIVSLGSGHKFLKDSKVVIGWNTTAILEGIAANRFLLIPYFYNKNKFFKSVELKLGLQKISYGNSKNDFIKKLNFLVKKVYKKNQIYNKLTSLDYHLGNADNKAGLRLNKFLKRNLRYKNH